MQAQIMRVAGTQHQAKSIETPCCDQVLIRTPDISSGFMYAVLCCANSDKGVHLIEGIAVQDNEEPPGLLGYCQGNTVLVLLLGQRYLK